MTLLNSGIYKIINIANDKFYIGSAVDLDKRYSNHKWNLENNRHYNILLQRAFVSYGSINFEFHILERCLIDKLIEREQFYIDNLKPDYNLAPVAGSNLGVKYSEVSKSKMSAWQIGRKMSEDAKYKMSVIKRKPEKWPHVQGNRCECGECKAKVREYKKLKAREYRAREYA